MVFSSFSFIFLFLPAVCAGYMLTPRKFRNLFLFLASLVFYAWGEPAFVFLMLASILINYSAGRIIGQLGTGRPQAARMALAMAIALNLMLLGFFKYATFLARSLLEWLAFFGNAPDMAAPDIPLPIGISFFTFQGLSYIMDVWRGEAAPPTATWVWSFAPPASGMAPTGLFWSGASGTAPFSWRNA